MANNLKQIRQQIEKLQAERTATQTAIPPVAVLEQKLRSTLMALAQPLEDFVNNCAAGLNTAEFGYLTPATPPMLARAAFGLNLDAERIEQIIATAKTRAIESDTGQMRLTDSEKLERLDDLNRRLYVLGLDEQTLIGSEPQRRDANAACVLGIPLDAAIEFNLL